MFFLVVAKNMRLFVKDDAKGCKFLIHSLTKV